jgi:hypothetical protein
MFPYQAATTANEAQRFLEETCQFIQGNKAVVCKTAVVFIRVTGSAAGRAWSVYGL